MFDDVAKYLVTTLSNENMKVMSENYFILQNYRDEKYNNTICKKYKEIDKSIIYLTHSDADSNEYTKNIDSYNIDKAIKKLEAQGIIQKIP